MSVQFKKLTSLSFGTVPFSIKGFSSSSQLYGTAKLKPKFRGENRPTGINKILVVDDQSDLLCSISNKLETKLGVRTLSIDPNSAIPIKDQVLTMADVESPDLIVMDGNLGESAEGKRQTGSEIVKELRAQGFKGYIVANSNDPILNWEMKDSGADFSARDKYTRHGKIKQLSLFINRYFQEG